MLYSVIYALQWIIRILQSAIVIKALLSWFVRPDNGIYMFLSKFTEPVVGPFRPLAYKITNGKLPLDLAPLFAYFALSLLSSGIVWLFNILLSLWL